MLYYEHKFTALGFNLIAGVDEAGRGPLAGPVVAAAVVLKSTDFKSRIDDSKKLSALQREKAYPEIIANSFFGLGIIDEKIIDKINILQADKRAMLVAIQGLVDKLRICGQDTGKMHILVDGNIFLKTKFPVTNIIKGDAKSLSIAAASILAKVTRDRIMVDYHKTFPQYNFLKHKGYPTAEHKQAIKEFGLCPIHRKTFSYV